MRSSLLNPIGPRRLVSRVSLHLHPPAAGSWRHGLKAVPEQSAEGDQQQQRQQRQSTSEEARQQQPPLPPNQPIDAAVEDSTSSSTGSNTESGAQPHRQLASQLNASPPSHQRQARLLDPLTLEILSIALPMLATLAADPIAGLVDTAYMGRLGATQLAGVGVALSVFNTTTKLFNVPLLSVTTSSVAAAAGREAAAAAAAAAAGAKTASSDRNTSSDSTDVPPESSTPSTSAAAGSSPQQQQQQPGASLSSAISSSTLIAAGVGAVQALLLLGSSSWASEMWGVSSSSPLWEAASQFLSIRALGAPVTVLLLVMQGVYRGLGDTRKPLYATLAANALNVVLGYGLIFSAGLGVRGAALATVLAQLLPLAWLFHKLKSKYGVTFTDASTLASVASLFAPTGYLVLRTAAITFTYAIATGLTARAGPAAAACHQVCFQVWLASSLMADSLSVACQTMLAKSLAVRDTTSARQVVSRCVGMASVLGFTLAAVLAVGRGSLPGIFTSDTAVQALVVALLPAVILSQPINAAAFVWDGVLFGAGGFRFASIQMAFCAAPAVLLMNLGVASAAAASAASASAAAAAASALAKLQWVWAGLLLVMALRALSIWLPYTFGVGPFHALRPQQQSQAGFNVQPQEQ